MLKRKKTLKKGITRLFLSLLVCCGMTNRDVRSTKPIVYLLSGQGSDHRIFSKLELDSNYHYQYLPYHIPDSGATMKEYAQELSQQIDTTKPFVLMGVSLGGMLSVELAHMINPKKVLIISSAKCNRELPKRYQRKTQKLLAKKVPPKMYKKSALFLQPIVEPDRKVAKDTFVSMLKDKNNIFLKRAALMISDWDRDTCLATQVVHIHGDNDHTIPIRNVAPNYVINKGSHMMTLTNPKELSSIINRELKKLTL